MLFKRELFCFVNFLLVLFVLTLLVGSSFEETTAASLVFKVFLLFDDLTDPFDSTDTVEHVELDEEADDSDFLPRLLTLMPALPFVLAKVEAALALLLPLRRLLSKLSTLVLSVSDDDEHISSVSIIN